MKKARKAAAAIPVAEPVSYLGQHLRGVDNGRIILPPDWRPAGSGSAFKVMLWPVITPEYVLVLPPSRWELMQRNLEGLSLADEQAAMVERLISSSTFQRTLDSYGRLPLPEEALRILNLRDEALLVGRLNKFEIWNPQKYAAALAKPDAQLIAESIKSIKI